MGGFSWKAGIFPGAAGGARAASPATRFEVGTHGMGHMGCLGSAGPAWQIDILKPNFLTQPMAKL